MTLLCRCVPFVDGDAVTGAVLLIRDVTELRKRDRLLLSKDATIREIHHRVKNNLQTISSLLRLQARRLTHPEAIAAVGESVRRIRTIALVHEALSREPGDDVTFIEIVRPLLRLAEEGLQSADRPVRFTVQGDGGRIPAAIATPLSVVLTELLQNAVDHGFPEGSSGGSVTVALGKHVRSAPAAGRRRRPRGRRELPTRGRDRSRIVDREDARYDRTERPDRDAAAHARDRRAGRSRGVRIAAWHRGRVGRSPFGGLGRALPGA